MNRGRQGFTLVDLTVTLLVTGLILLLAMQLLVEIQATMVEWRRRAPDPVPQFAIQMLRSDIQRSRGLDSAPGSHALQLVMPDGSRIVYDAFLGELVRSVIAPDGTPRGQRRLLSDVQLWSWHNSLAADLVEVQIVYLRHRDPGSRRLAGLRRVQATGRSPEALNLRFGQRARPGRRIW